MSLRRRIQLLLGAFLVLLAINAGLGLVNVTQRDRLVREAQRFEAARDQTTRLVADLVDQETGLRGYVITADEAFLQPYARGQANARRRTALLRETLADEPALLAKLDRIETATEAWRTAAAEPE
ncbi:MAG: CHASE3 domain-containing protein, partial [Actinomycetota bacterium]|nr:CHASE3 domain-containing protein [Actinomycetota bacterium]